MMQFRAPIAAAVLALSSLISAASAFAHATVMAATPAEGATVARPDWSR